MLPSIFICLVLASYNRRRALALLLLLRRQRRRRWWVRPINQERLAQGAFYHLVRSLSLDHELYYAYFRMTPAQMNYLLSVVGPSLRRLDTTYRKSIEPAQQLAVALRYIDIDHNTVFNNIILLSQVS